MDLLPEWGHEAVCVSDGLAAWQMLTGENPPQLAVLDWMMPGMDGVRLCCRLRERFQPPLAALHIILLTSRRQPQDVVRALDAGADDYLIKPFDMEELRARIQVGCRTITLQTQLQEQERLRGILQMAGAICHEMNQPLQTLLTSAQLLMENLSAEDPNYQSLAAIREGVDRLREVSHRVMNLARPHTIKYLDEQTRIVDLKRSGLGSSDRQPEDTYAKQQNPRGG